MTLFRLLIALALVAPLSSFAEVRDITFPVSGTYSFRNDYGDPRDGGARSHQGNDIIAAKMTPVVATVDGTVTFIAIPQASWGYSITIRDSEGYSYRYLHLNNDTPGTDDGAGGESNAYAAGINRGSKVLRGQVLGWVGDSGNAESTVSHLHFEISGPSGVINPYDSLFAAAGGNGSGTYTAPVVTGDTGSVLAEEAFVVTRQLQEGMVDRDVLGLHNELTTLGFYSGEITENFTSETREAVRKFQVSKGIFANGIATAETRKRIISALKTAGTVVPGPGPSTGSGALELGASGAVVTELQKKLVALGYLTATPTGYFGPLTHAAVIAFQKAQGIDPIGVVGPKTKAALAVAVPVSLSDNDISTSDVTMSAKYLFTKALVVGASGEEVRQLQLVLIAGKYLSASATGYFGALTEAALKAYQSAHGIDPLGIVGPKTRAELNSH